MQPAPQRISRHNLFMEIAHLVGERSTCPRAQVGAILVRENRIVSMGYNGSPSGMSHCTDRGCELEVVDMKQELKTNEGPIYITNTPVEHCIRAVHAEANAVAWAARAGVSLKDTEMWTTLAICLNCAKLAINAGVRGVHYCKEYDPRGIELLREAGILVWHEESC